MAHQPIQFGPQSDDAGRSADTSGAESEFSEADARAEPVALDLKKDQALTVQWNDGQVSVYPIAYLRRNSPSAEAKAVRESLAQNPLTVLTSTSTGPITATDAELVGNYALRIQFSDGHRTGLFTWSYLREIDPARKSDDDSSANPDLRVRP